LLSEAIFKTLVKAYWFSRRKEINRIYKDLQRNQSLSAEELRLLQFDKLKSLLCHCYETVPYYRTIFAEIGLEPEDIRDLDDFKRIPVLTKADIRQNHDLLISNKFTQRELFMSSTGGSTGEPVHFSHSRYYRQISDAIIMRYWGWGGWRLGDRVAWLWGAPQETSALSTMKGGFLWWLNRRKLFDAFDMNEGKLLQWVDEFQKYRPRFINGYATSITTFAKFLRENGIWIDGIRGVFSTAEKLFPQQRAIIEETFKCKVYDHYGSREIFGIAAECGHGSMHVNSDIVHVEFEPLKGGELHRMIVTALDNYAMPLIRYEIGDNGEPSNRGCTCGLPFPIMELKVGRVTDNFVTPDRRVVHGEFFTHLMYGITGVAGFQFRQVRPDLIELSLVRDGYFSDSTGEKVEEVVRRIRDDFSINVNLNYVDSIPLTVSGKHRFTVCELKL
jgi:phenylacetate-CoA ligase